jgi:DNA (cytosine-5)-methyltransferase 1
MPNCVGISEIDKYAFAIFRRHFPGVRNFGDATKLVPEDIPDFDLLVAGFPCQAFSIAGKRQGFNEARGTLFFEIARVLSHKRPKHFVLENVKGLGSHDDGETQNKMLGILSDLGYFVERVLLNSKDYGVPQNRERVYFIGHSGACGGGEVLSIGSCDGEIVEAESERAVSGTISTKNQNGQCQFDGSTTLVVGRDISMSLNANYHKGAGALDVEKGIRQMIVGDRGPHRDDIKVGTLRTHKDGEGFREMQSGVAPALNARPREDGSGQGVVAIPVLTPDRKTKRQNGRRMKEQGEARFTLTAQDQHGVLIKVADGKQGQRVYDVEGIAATLQTASTGGTANEKYLIDNLIRRFTPIECERLQAFKDNWTAFGLFEQNGELVEVPISDTQRYKTTGNAVTTYVIEAVIRRMREVGCLA